MGIKDVLKTAAKKIIPEGRPRQVVGRLAWDLERKASPRWRESQRRLAACHNRHRGERAFIIGNGPSLNRTDLSKLKGEITFGLNRFYLKFADLGFSTTYLVSVNVLVIEQCATELAEAACPKFISWRGKDHVPFTDDMVFLRPARDVDFSTDPVTHGTVEGATVTYVAMQLAYWMGIREVVLIGVDHSFATKGTPHEEIVSEGDDPNHFDPRYFGKGFRWQLPDLDTSEQSFAVARGIYEADGRRILDATMGGKLQVFPKIDYDGLWTHS